MAKTKVSFTATSDGPEHTRAIAASLASLLEVGDLLILTGDLGAGKTCFTQGLGAALGVERRITSPTFTLANRYDGRLTLHHLDVYRLDSVAETLDLDLPELLESGATVIEWGDRILEVLPSDHLVVALRYAEPIDASLDTDREIEISAIGQRWRDRWDRVQSAVGRSESR